MLSHQNFINSAQSVLSHKKEGERYLLLYADILDFQLVNHYYGIDGGDNLLLAAENTLAHIRQVAAFERVFSDQFIILAHTRAETERDVMLTHIEEYMDAFVTAQQQQYPACHLKIICGIYEMADDDLVTSIECANAARKSAKKDLVRAAVFYDATVRDQILDRQNVEQDINLALQEERFTFYLQPKVDLITGEIVGAEALARGLASDGTIKSPDIFVPIMEENGTILDLDFMILRKVCAYLQGRIRTGKPYVRISVNLSRLHIANEGSTALLHEIVRSYDVPPEALEFELTETILLHEFTGAKRLIDKLHDYGYDVSIDDFGAGYAGINIWQNLNFDVLKLDRSFLAEEEPIKTRNAAIVPNIINIAQQLDVRVICEGVETDAQCRYLLRMGCTAAQGFLFSRPIPHEDFSTLLENHPSYAVDFQGVPASTVAVPLPPEEKPAAPAPKKRHTAPAYLSVLLTCAVALVVSVVATLAFFRENVTSLFIESVQNNLDGYTAGQISETSGRVRDVENTLNALAAVIEHEGDTSVESYVDAISTPTMTVLYSTVEQYDMLAASGSATEEDVQYIERMKQGETVISSIRFSTAAGNIYCFTVGVPVFVDGEMIGGLRAIVDAATLLSTSQFASPYGSVVDSVLIGPNNEVIYRDGVDGNFGTIEGLAEELGLPGAAASIYETLEGAEVRSRWLGRLDGVSFFTSAAPFSFNGWQLLVLFRADDAASIVNRLMLYTITSTIVLLVVILTICLFLFDYLRRWSRRLSLSEQRYQLLEQFSDTALFDYDCQKDELHLTPNACTIFRIRSPEIKNFIGKISDSSSVYPADFDIVRGILEGKSYSDKQEVRIRLKHPTIERYAWCLVQFKYLYNGDKLASIIGKVVNIDEQQRHEEYLLEKSARDGLTGLFNRVNTEDRIRQCLERDDCGALILLDVDNFKQINDTFGHDIGDRVLQEIAGYVQTVFARRDVLGRLGGDEMLLYMSGISDHELIIRKLRLLQNLLEEHARSAGTPTTVSIGVACFPEHGKNFKTLYLAADQAMYNAKHAGRNCFKFYGD